MTEWDSVALKRDYFNKEHKVVTDGIMTLRASKKMWCNVWSYDLIDRTLATEKQWRHMINWFTAIYTAIYSHLV